jgi:hypothetical protein
MINYSEYAQDIALNTAAQIGALYRQKGWAASDVGKVAKAVKDEQAKAIFLKAYNSPSKEHVEVSKTQTAFGIWLFCPRVCDHLIDPLLYNKGALWPSHRQRHLCASGIGIS